MLIMTPGKLMAEISGGVMGVVVEKPYIVWGCSLLLRSRAVLSGGVRRAHNALFSFNISAVA
jgi:hypothetical protein